MADQDLKLKPELFDERLRLKEKMAQPEKEHEELLAEHSRLLAEQEMYRSKERLRHSAKLKIN